MNRVSKTGQYQHWQVKPTLERDQQEEEDQDQKQSDQEQDDFLIAQKEGPNHKNSHQTELHRIELENIEKIYFRALHSQGHQVDLEVEVVHKDQTENLWGWVPLARSEALKFQLLSDGAEIDFRLLPTEDGFLVLWLADVDDETQAKSLLDQEEEETNVLERWQLTKEKLARLSLILQRDKKGFWGGFLFGALAGLLLFFVFFLLFFR